MSSATIQTSSSTIIPADETSTPRIGAAVEPLARHAGALAEPFPAAAENPIPHSRARRPRVRSSGTFVRLTASETLHDSGMAALRRKSVEAALGRYTGRVVQFTRYSFRLASNPSVARHPGCEASRRPRRQQTSGDQTEVDPAQRTTRGGT